MFNKYFHSILPYHIIVILLSCFFVQAVPPIASRVGHVVFDLFVDAVFFIGQSVGADPVSGR